MMRATYIPRSIDKSATAGSIDFGSHLRLRNSDLRPRHSIVDALKTLTSIASYSRHLYYSPLGLFHHGRDAYRLARYVFQGPAGGDEPVKIGLFAAVNGDDPVSTQALVEFLFRLDLEPERAKGYQIYVYPISNPTGFEDGTRKTRSGHDLLRELWSGSKQPEAFYIERELGVLQFQGVIHLVARDEVDAINARVGSAILQEALVQPALKTAEKFLPAAKTGGAGRNLPGTTVAREQYEGGLVNPAELKPAPFEITFETPRKAPPELRKKAAQAALLSILESYLPFLASHQNI